MTRKLRNLTSALALSAALALPAWAQVDTEITDRAGNRAQVEEQVTAETDERLAEKRTRLIEEAVSALDETRKAIGFLEKDKPDEALAALAVATGKLETVVARSPELALAPVDVNYLSHDVLGSLQAIRDIGNRIEDLVDDGEFEAARSLLRDFASEIVVETTHLPLATYPDAILEAARLVDEGKSDEAITALNLALSTQVVTETAIALPPLRAEAMLEKARALLDGSGEGDSGEDGEGEDAVATTGDTPAPSAGDYVEAARQELEIAEALGYGRERDFEDLHEALDALDEQIGADEDTGGIFATIGERFERLKERLFDASST